MTPYRTCQCCGRRWETVEAMRRGTTAIGPMSDGADGVLELCNCPCGATLVVAEHDCPPTLRDPGQPPTPRDGCASATGCPDSEREESP